MTNFEFYKDEILKICEEYDRVAVSNGKLCVCDKIDCGECDFYRIKNNGYSCVVNLIKWLYAEQIEKPTLNKYERALCEALKTGYIARDLSDKLYIFECKPLKGDSEWHHGGEYIYILCINKFNPEIQFDFIKWKDKEPWRVEDLLKLEVRE